jgi:hypothetical protein
MKVVTFSTNEPEVIIFRSWEDFNLTPGIFWWSSVELNCFRIREQKKNRNYLGHRSPHHVNEAANKNTPIKIESHWLVRAKRVSIQFYLGLRKTLRK